MTGRPLHGKGLPTLVGKPWTDADAEAWAEAEHAALHVGTFVPSWRSCPEHLRATDDGTGEVAP